MVRIHARTIWTLFFLFTLCSVHSARAGPPTDQLRDRIDRVVKINTEMRRAHRIALEKQLAARPDEYAIIRLMGTVINAVRAVVEHKMEIFGSAGKATAR
jgi:fructose/tagatose bisphosphate aldolase